MKKRLALIAFTVALLIIAMPTIAANALTIVTEPIDLSGATKDQSGPQWAWDQSSNKLTLQSGFEMKINDANGKKEVVGITLPEEASVDVEETAKISVSVNVSEGEADEDAAVIGGISGKGTLNITGTGTLTVDIDNIGQGTVSDHFNAGAISVDDDDSTLTTKGFTGKLILKGRDYAVTAGDSIEISGGDIEAYSTGEKCFPPIYTSGNITINNCSVTAGYPSNVNSEIAVINGKNITIENSKIISNTSSVDSSSTLRAEGGIIAIRNGSVVEIGETEKAIYGGYIQIEDSKVTAKATYYGMDCNRGCKIVNSKVKLTETEGYITATGIRCFGELNIENSNVVVAALGGESTGILVIDDYNRTDAALKVSSSRVEASGTKRAIGVATEADTNPVTLGKNIVIIKGGSLYKTSSIDSSLWTYSTKKIETEEDEASLKVIMDTKVRPTPPDVKPGGDSDGTNTPDTGDRTNIELYGVLLASGIILIGSLVWQQRRVRK